jgi:hypothetical protein
MTNRTPMAAALSPACSGALAQTGAAATRQRDLNRRTRMHQGVTDTSPGTHEAAKLEKQKNRVERLQAQNSANAGPEKRVEGGVQNGSRSNREVARRERGQARVDGKESRAGRNGRLSLGERSKHLKNTDAQVRS